MPRRRLLAILALLAMLSSLTLGALFWQQAPQQSLTSQATVHVTGSDWQWQFSVVWPDGTIVESVGEAAVPAGIGLRFLVTSADVAYSAYIPALSVKIDAIPNHIAEFVFNGLPPADYLIRNVEFAGIQGIDMTAVLHVIA